MFQLLIVSTLGLLCLVGVGAADVQSRLRIVGGSLANINKFPYQGSLMEKGSHTCGCSLISEFHALTAAHCVEDVKSESHDLKVRAGSGKLDAEGVVKNVKAFKIHPFYNGNTMEYDIAVLILDSPFELSNTIQTIDLADTPPEDGSEGVASGFGLTKNNGNLSPVLKETKLTVMSKETCSKTAYGKNIKDSMFCAKGKGTDACEGDSGGPFVVFGKQAGVISFGFDCASDKYAGVYTAIYKCLTFINKALKM